MRVPCPWPPHYESVFVVSFLKWSQFDIGIGVFHLRIGFLWLPLSFVVASFVACQLCDVAMLFCVLQQNRASDMNLSPPFPQQGF